MPASFPAALLPGLAIVLLALLLSIQPVTVTLIAWTLVSRFGEPQTA